MIASSWQRCWARINPTHTILFNRFNPDHLLAAQVASFDLISISRPVMEDIFQNIDSSGIALLLLNGTGYILDIVAAPDTLRQLKEEGIQVGVLFTEEYVGTNAFGLALYERMPVQVVGAEHYSRQFHGKAGAAAPIFETTGRPLGVLGLLASTADFQSLSLGLVTAGARAIEAQHQADQLLADYNSQLDELNALLDTISEGILLWNDEHTLVHINRAAAGLIDLPPQNLVGKNMSELVTYPAFIGEAIAKRESLTDIEASIQVGQRSIACVLSLRFVYRKNNLGWVILTFRPVKEVRQLVHRQVGANAPLSLEDIPGDSQQIRRVHNFVKSVAPAMASVLIRGRGGTGKNALASAIHNESPRRDGPFMIFPCSSIPGELAASEMLGYEEGSHPRRSGGRPGKFELAQGGTCFFQDVEALPLDAQAILLNVLEMHIVQRLGSERPVEVDVRVIASTSSDIEKLVEEGNFRADLFYRLSTFTITVPSLRDRPRDIPLIVERILKHLSRQLGHPLALEPGVIEIVKKYPWPGNIRELESVLGRAATQAGKSGLIAPEHLPAAVRHLSYLRRDGVGFTDGVDFTAARPLVEVEREAILQTAQLARGNVTRMARVLGVSRTTLWRRIKDYNIALENFRQK